MDEMIPIAPRRKGCRGDSCLIFKQCNERRALRRGKAFPLFSFLFFVWRGVWL